ncbi:MAG TPA: NADH-quinone oxidoreductase subunit C [Bryobacteraceae bacterium]|nr:NADH-quinone oxidoreductase subunit C [Bryobacteraceae bacterium]
MIPETLRENPLAAAFEDIATAARFEFGELTIEVAPENILTALGRLKRDLKFERLSTVTGVDRFPAEPRFEVVYHLQAIAKKQRIRIKARLSGERPEIESATGIYRAADWYERETFDLFGIIFLNHPELRRIMMPDDWEGYPLRKDYPITGTRY